MQQFRSAQRSAKSNMEGLKTEEARLKKAVKEARDELKATKANIAAEQQKMASRLRENARLSIDISRATEEKDDIVGQLREAKAELDSVEATRDILHDEIQGMERKKMSFVEAERRLELENQWSHHRMQW